MGGEINTPTRPVDVEPRKHERKKPPRHGYVVDPTRGPAGSAWGPAHGPPTLSACREEGPACDLIASDDAAAGGARVPQRRAAGTPPPTASRLRGAEEGPGGRQRRGQRTILPVSHPGLSSEHTGPRPRVFSNFYGDYHTLDTEGS